MFYAIAKGNKIGIYNTWSECQLYIKDYKYPRFKKFNTIEEAEDFIKENNEINNNLDNLDYDYCVYTDGACTGNGKPHAKAGIGIYFGENDSRNVSECVIGKQTNNTAELGAILKLYYIIKDDILANKKIAIITDSVYAIRCVTTYGKKCSLNWNKDIPNKEIVKQAYELYKDKINVKFIHILGHTKNTDIHTVGNRNADLLATQAIAEHKV
jgi:ribonuclease HI